MATKKFTITLNETVLENVDKYAETMGVTRSAAIAFLINYGLAAANTPDTLKQLLGALDTAKSMMNDQLMNKATALSKKL